MDEENLNKLLQTLGVDSSKIAPENLKKAAELFSQSGTGAAPAGDSASAIKDALAGNQTDPYLSDQLKVAAAEKASAQSFAASPNLPAPNQRVADRLNNQLFAKIRKGEFDRAGVDDPLADQYKQFLPKEARTLKDYQKENAAVQAKNERIQGAQAEKASSESLYATAEGDGGAPFASFRDSSGNIEGPKQLKERLIREGNEAFKDRAPGSPGYDTREADKAAGARFNALFRDNSAVRDADPKDRMSVMEGLKQARGDVLKNLAEQRRNDPNSKPVGMVTSVQDSSGQELMRRGESGVRLAKGGLSGAVGGLEETPGKMELTPAGERAVRDRTVSANISGSDIGGQGGGEGKVVAGRYGTAVGGLSITDQLKANGTLPQNFQLTEKQKVGQEALPEAYVKGRDALMGKATSVAKEQGQITDPATRTVMANTSPDKVAGIDAQANAYRNAGALKTELAKNDAAIQKTYSPDQIKSLDKTIATANKTGGTAFDKGGGNFGVRPSTPQDDQLKRKLMGRRA